MIFFKCLDHVFVENAVVAHPVTNIVVAQLVTDVDMRCLVRNSMIHRYK